MALTTNIVAQTVEVLIQNQNDEKAQQKLADYLEYLACALFRLRQREGLWCDGVTIKLLEKRKAHQLFLSGEMWTAKGGASDQWQESAEILISDQRATKQGILIKLWVEDWEGEAQLDDLINNLRESASSAD